MLKEQRLEFGKVFGPSLSEQINILYTESGELESQLEDDYFTESESDGIMKKIGDKLHEMIEKIKKFITDILDNFRKSKVDKNEVVYVDEKAYKKTTSFLNAVKNFFAQDIKKIMSFVKNHKIASVGITAVITTFVASKIYTSNQKTQYGIPKKKSEILDAIDQCNKNLDEIRKKQGVLMDDFLSYNNPSQKEKDTMTSINKEISASIKESKMHFDRRDALQNATKNDFSQMLYFIRVVIKSVGDVVRHLREALFSSSKKVKETSEA